MSDSLLGRPWAQAPWELVTADISHAAFRVAMAIQLHRRPSGKAPFPSQRTLAEMCHCSIQTVERAVRELKEKGVLQTRQRRRNGGEHSTCSYELRVPAPSLIREGPTSLIREGAEVDSSLLTQSRNELWDVLTEIFGSAETETAKSARGKIVRSLAGAGATAEQVVLAVERYHKFMPPGSMCTEFAVEKWWGALTQKKVAPAPCSECSVGGGLHLADCSRANRKDGAMAQ